MTDIVRVPFRGTEILAIDNGGQPYVFLRPAVESIGLDYSAQYRKLQRRSWACVAQVTTQLPGDTQARPYITTDVRTFLMLLATIDERQVAEEIRPLLVAYQQEVAGVIEQYWTKGGVINPRATEDQLDELEVARRYVLALEAKKELEATVAEQSTQLAIAAPKAEYVDSFVNPADDASTIRVFAGQLGVGEKQLRDWMVGRGLIYRRPVDQRWSRSKQRLETVYQWLARSPYAKWFNPVDQPQAPRLHNGQMATTLYVTPVGKVQIRRLLMKHPIDGGEAQSA